MEQSGEIGLLLVEAQAPEVARQTSARTRLSMRRAPGPDEQQPWEEMSAVLLAEMLDELPPSWTKRRTFYESRQRTPGLRHEPVFYAAEADLGSRFDARA